jgi:hypothetical protein
LDAFIVLYIISNIRVSSAKKEKKKKNPLGLGFFSLKHFSLFVAPGGPLTSVYHLTRVAYGVSFVESDAD